MAKSFRVARNKREPLPFELAIEQEDGPDKIEEFHARGSVPGALLLDAAAAVTQGGGYTAAAVKRFLNTALVKEDRERFWAIMTDEDLDTDMPQIIDIINWLMEEYGERPTESA